MASDETRLLLARSILLLSLLAPAALAEEKLPKWKAGQQEGTVQIDGRQSFDPVEKPEGAHTVLFVGDPKDGNYGKSRPDAAESLRKKGWEVLVHEHNGGHTVPRKETELVFAWIAEQIKAKPKAKP